jgi:hypothetical protein
MNGVPVYLLSAYCPVYLTNQRTSGKNAMSQWEIRRQTKTKIKMHARRRPVQYYKD